MNDQNQGINANLPAFDQKPIGNKVKFTIPEYAQNEQPSMIPESNIVQKAPLGKRLQSSVLKNKKEALQELLALVALDVKQYKPFEQLTIQFISYSHASIVDRGLKLLTMYLNGGQQTKIDPKVIIKTVIEKCLSTDKVDKQEIKKSCQQILFWYMDNQHEQSLLNELNDDLLNKNPKIIGTSILFIANLLNNYGIKRMKGLEKFMKHLEILSTPPKPMAKSQTIEFYKQAYKWMGENVFKQFKMHFEVKDQIIKFSKEYEKTPMEIKRGLKKQQIGQNKKPVFHMDAQQEDNQEQVDALSMYTSRWVDQVLQIEKWKDKKATLDQFIKKTKVSNILPPKDVSHFITLIKRLLAENNINLLLCGFSVAQNLSKGLKKQFVMVAKNIAPYIFSKLKDAKPVIVQAAQETLKSLMNCFGLEDLAEQIKAGLDDKAHFMRIQVLKFLSAFTQRKQQRIMTQMRLLLQKMVKLTEDGNEIVRKQSLEILCNLKKAHDMKFFGDKLKNIDPKKFTIIQSVKVNENNEMDIENVYNEMNVIPIAKKQPYSIEQKLNFNNNKNLNKIPQKSAISKNKSDQYSNNSSVQSLIIKNVSNKTINDLGSLNQSIRSQAYQQILNKCNYQDLKQLMFNIKSTVVKQSTPNLLKMVISIAKKYSGMDPIDMETLEFVLKHDWRKSRQLIQDFMNNNKFTPQASDHIRHNNLSLQTINPKSTTLQNSAVQQANLKSFMKELQFLLTKMTNPVSSIRIESAQHAIRYLQSMAVISESQLIPSNGWNQDCINKFCGMVRFRLNDAQEVAKIYSDLLKVMVHKGILTRNKGLKSILQGIFQKLKERKPYIKQLFEEIANTNSQLLFSMILVEIVKEVHEPIIQFIVQNNELFIRNAEHKLYICPILNLLFNSDLDNRLKTELEKILDQIVELNGESILQAEVKKTQINHAEQYLAKYNIIINTSNNNPKNIGLKSDRLKIQEQNPWPLFATPNHILKLINLMTSLKEPLPTLATPYLFSKQTFQGIISNIDEVFYAEYSDILLKWIYWRAIIDPEQMMPQLLKFSYNTIFVTNMYLSQSEFTIILGITINVMNRFNNQYQQLICNILKLLYDIDPLYKQKSLSFWVNIITKQNTLHRIPVDEILKVIIAGYTSDLISQHLTSLARSPEVVKNQCFLRFLSSNYDHQFLTVSGFRVFGTQRPGRFHAQIKTLLSDLGGPENMIKITPQEKRYYVTLFQKNSSIELERQLSDISKSPFSKLIDTHMKIIYSIVVPFIKRQITVVNIFTYFKEFNKILTNQEGSKYSHCLKDLTRMLLYFLIDLDENCIQNKEQITKTVNRIILMILWQSENRHMLQVLFLLLKTQLNISPNANNKIQHLIYKCIGKVVKSPKFKEKWEENIIYITSQTSNIFNQFQIKLDHPLIRTINNTWKTDIMALSHYRNIVQDHLNSVEVNQTLIDLIRQPLTSQFIADPAKEKDNNSAIKSMGTVSINKMISAKKEQIS